MDYNKYLDEFVDDIYDAFISENDGGMKSPDMFTMYVMLKELQPELVIESGVWKGQGTKIIREAVGEDCKIICLEPRILYGWQDDGNTEYYLGEDFVDFEKLNLSEYKSEKSVAIFDDHINAEKRLFQCKLKYINYVIFNDNYPKNCGSHFTLEHLKTGDSRYGNQTLLEQFNEIVEEYKIYPNIFPGKIKTGEGYFDCESYFKEPFKEEAVVDKYKILYTEKETYRWNTLVKLK